MFCRNCGTEIQQGTKCCMNCGTPVQTMYTIYVKFNCLEGKREAFVEKMRSEGILDAIRAEDGCIMYDYYYSEEDPCLLLLIEQWESKEHQQIHCTLPHMDKMRTFKDDYIKDTLLGEITLD